MKTVNLPTTSEEAVKMVDWGSYAYMGDQGTLEYIVTDKL